MYRDYYELRDILSVSHCIVTKSTNSNLQLCTIRKLTSTFVIHPVHQPAVVRNAFDVRVESKDIMLGNVAFLRCLVPDTVRDIVKVTAWQRGEELHVPEQADIGTTVLWFCIEVRFFCKCSTYHTAGRFAVVSGTGQLHIRAVRPDDGTKKFSCLVSNVLNGERRQSEAVYLSVKGMLLLQGIARIAIAECATMYLANFRPDDYNDDDDDYGGFVVFAIARCARRALI